MAKKREAWQPPAYSETGEPNTYGKDDIRAIQAMAEGTAGEAEQKRALDCIINRLAMTYDEPFRTGADDVRCYLLGRRSVGLAIVKLIRLKPEIFENE